MATRDELILQHYQRRLIELDYQLAVAKAEKLELIEKYDKLDQQLKQLQDEITAKERATTNVDS